MVNDDSDARRTGDRHGKHPDPDPGPDRDSATGEVLREAEHAETTELDSRPGNRQQNSGAEGDALTPNPDAARQHGGPGEGGESDGH
jgi:hypothetical protein